VAHIFPKESFIIEVNNWVNGNEGAEIETRFQEFAKAIFSIDEDAYITSEFVDQTHGLETTEIVKYTDYLQFNGAKIKEYNDKQYASFLNSMEILRSGPCKDHQESYSKS
jgi:hypothetical protein